MAPGPPYPGHFKEDDERYEQDLKGSRMDSHADLDFLHCLARHRCSHAGEISEEEPERFEPAY
jgi:hypothetical protein